MATGAAFDFAPHAQLLRTLLPRARGIYVYAPDAELIWSADGTDLHDLRVVVLDLLESAGVAAALTGTRHMLEDMPAYACVLRDELGGILGVLAVVCRPVGREADLPSHGAVERTLAPLLALTRRELGHHRVVDTGSVSIEDTQELQWLFDVSHVEALDKGTDSLQGLLDAFATRAACDVTLLHVPARRLDRLAATCALTPKEARSLAELASRNLMRVAQLQQKTLIINKVRDDAGGGLVPFRILCVPLMRRGQTIGVAVAFNRADGRAFEAREARMLERLAPRLLEIIDTRFDGTTGLLTRQAFDEQAANLLARAPQAPRWIVHGDVDGLSATNELYGFGAGDSVLRAIADLWRAEVAPGDSVVARLASDSFVALLDTSSPESARAWAEAVRAGIEALALPDPLAGARVTMGFGLAPLLPGTMLEHGLVSAESACRIAKELGSDRLEVYAPSEARPAERQRAQKLHRALLDALEHGKLELYAQTLSPLWDPTRAPRYEILVRLPVGPGTTLAAEQFMAIASRHRLAGRVDGWVLGEVLRQLATAAPILERAGAVFSLNLSGESLQRPTLVDDIRAALDAHQLPPSLLSFEISEPVIVANMRTARATIGALRGLGCSCSIDDFGTGATSLAYLNTLPVSALKIDGLFVRDLTTERKSEQMVRAILQIARQLALDTVAECVESREAAQQLTALGVTYGQGLALGAPEPFGIVLARMLRAATPMLTEAVGRAMPDGSVH